MTAELDKQFYSLFGELRRRIPDRFAAAADSAFASGEEALGVEFLIDAVTHAYHPVTRAEIDRLRQLYRACGGDNPESLDLLEATRTAAAD